MNNATVIVTVELEYAFGAVGDEWTIKELRERTVREAKQAAAVFCADWGGKHHRRAKVLKVGTPNCEIGGTES